MKQRYTTTLLGALCTASLACVACSDGPSPHAERPKSYDLRIEGTAFTDDPHPHTGPVAIYQFSEGMLYKAARADLPADGRTTITALRGTRLYVLAGATLPATEAATTEAEFREAAYGAGLHGESAPEFLSGVAALDAPESGAPTVVVAMKRGVARIDLDTSSDAKIAVTQVTVENAPELTLPFAEGSAAGGGTVRYTARFDTPLAGEREDLFRLFESASPICVRVAGTYDGIPVRIETELPNVERNKVYRLSIRNIGATLEGIFEIRPWEEGGTVVGKPDAGSRIVLDAAESAVPPHVTVDYAGNTLEVPASGVDTMTLAFAADTRIDILSVEGAGPGVAVGTVSVDERADRIVSSFGVAIAAQGSGRLGYTVLVHLKNALLQGTYDYVTIRVAPSERQIETAELGGSVWMAFNARSSDLEDQIYPLDGMSVEQMYADNWINTVGGLFQSGRKYMYVPWQGYNPSNNLGGQTADIPWQSDTHMPCPEGYRIPTRSEWESLLPKGTTVPGSYVAGNGERISATLHTAAGTLQTPTGVTGTQRYVRLASEDTGESLILPLAGGKGDKATTNNPSFGSRAVLWTSQRDGCPGGYAWTYWLPFEADSTTVVAERQLQMEAFASVRCVKR